MRRPAPTAALALLLAAALTACGGDDAEPPAGPPESKAPAAGLGEPVQPDQKGGGNGVEVQDAVASGLEIPAAIAFLPDGSALVGERDSGRVLRVTDSGGSSVAGSVPDLDTSGEGGLLGLLVPSRKLTGGRTTVYAYYTSDGTNRVARLPYEDGRLGRPETLLDGIPAGDHNGGAMAVGPDRKLYVGTGDDASKARDRKNLGGKILRLELDGSVPAGNPFKGSPVWTLGHHDVAGLAFDARKTLWATESGQERYQELNRIARGKDYGWPVAEGQSADTRFVRAYHRFIESEDAAPRGLAIVGQVAYIADLKGGKLYAIPLHDGDSRESVAVFGGTYGPLRTVAATPKGGLWLATSNQAGDPEGTATPSSNGDSILRITVPD